MTHEPAEGSSPSSSSFLGAARRDCMHGHCSSLLPSPCLPPATRAAPGPPHQHAGAGGATPSFSILWKRPAPPISQTLPGLVTDNGNLEYLSSRCLFLSLRPFDLTTLCRHGHLPFINLVLNGRCHWEGTFDLQTLCWQAYMTAYMDHGRDSPLNDLEGNIRWKGFKALLPLLTSALESLESGSRLTFSSFPRVVWQLL